MRIRELKSELIKRLALFDNPALEARVLLSHFLSLSTSELITRDSENVPPEKEEMILSALNKRLTGLPMAYITGEKEFFGYLFEVNEDVLIPQPDTEILVESALSMLKERSSVLDICTGSGAIITAIKAERADVDAHFSDISEKALIVAIKNFERITGEKSDARAGDLFEPWHHMKFDMITANAPYVTKAWYESVSIEVKKEPPLALLDEEEDGLGIITRIIEQAPLFLKKEGRLILEADYRQHGKIRRLLKEHGFSSIGTEKDLAQLERVSYGILI